MKVKDTDKGARKRVDNIVSGLGGGGLALLVGIQGDKAGEKHRSEVGDLTVGLIATFHEFGFGVPERSWLRGWVDANNSFINDLLRRGARQIILGKDPEQIAGAIGAAFVASIQQRIVSGIAPPLDAATIKAKGSSTPLIDTGQLKSAITSVLEGGRKAKGGPVTV
jgi:hypothetical protein